jgi:hypothetical protein
MSVTMTPGDIAVALAVGLIGSLLAAYVYKILPYLTNRVALWWAARSDNARKIKIQQKVDELNNYRIDLENPVTYISKLIRLLGACIILFFISIFFITLIVGLEVMAARDAVSPVSPIMRDIVRGPFPVTMDQPIEAISILISFFVLVILRYVVQRFIYYSSIQRNIERLEREIARLSP